nr:hypothetical protein [Sphingopyxis sp. PET50]
MSHQASAAPRIATAAMIQGSGDERDAGGTGAGCETGDGTCAGAGAGRGAASGAASGARPHNSSRLISTLRQPRWSGSPCQSDSSANWIWLNGSGGMTSSIAVCTSFFWLRATSASARTHSDCADCRDQTTIAAFAMPIFSVITSP